ncbi:hypothetical protein [Haloglycomyces albus]|uniref:hypothetical protein n=1 Tax=Haloglycomyces albus TaxID=526067 RepID=UPI000688B6B0|nr:hypothetical protein [Haloglycomyces albus]
MVTFDDPDHADGYRYLLVRENRSTGERAFYHAWWPTPAGLAQLIHVAGSRWSIEEAFQHAKSCHGLDHHQVRTWTSTYRHLTFVITAFLIHLIATLQFRTTNQSQDVDPISLPHTAHLIAVFCLSMRATVQQVIAWSDRKRRHARTAKECHYKRRDDHLPPLKHKLRLEY